MKNRRDCCHVIQEMLMEIPLAETELHKALNWNYEDASYKAPEETLQWLRTQQTLIKYIPNPEKEWEIKVFSIFSTMTVDDIKKEIAKNKENE